MLKVEHRNVRDNKNRSIKMILEKEEQDMEDKFAAIGFPFHVSFLLNFIKQDKPGQVRGTNYEGRQLSSLRRSSPKRSCATRFSGARTTSLRCWRARIGWWTRATRS